MALADGVPTRMIEVVVYYQGIDWSPLSNLIAGTTGDDKVRIWDVSDIVSNQAHGQ